MGIKLLVLVLIIKTVEARIKIDLKIDKEQNVNISYSRPETDLITDEDKKSFQIENDQLLSLLEEYFGRRPTDAFLGSPTPWGDLYKKYNWEPVKRVLWVKSARANSFTQNPVVVLSKDFENSSNQTIKVNTGITHSVENTLTTNWSIDELTVSQEMEYEFNVVIAESKEIASLSFITNWGISENKSKTEIIGNTYGMEVELKPGDAVTAVLSANHGYLELEVVHMATLRGNVAVNFKKAHREHHFWAPLIHDVLRNGGFRSEITVAETLRFGYYVEANITVYDKKTGLLL